MENYNSETGEGCDVENAVPFYHWGALNALIPMLQNEKTIALINNRPGGTLYECVFMVVYMVVWVAPGPPFTHSNTWSILLLPQAVLRPNEHPVNLSSLQDTRPLDFMFA